MAGNYKKQYIHCILRRFGKGIGAVFLALAIVLTPLSPFAALQSLSSDRNSDYKVSLSDNGEIQPLYLMDTNSIYASASAASNQNWTRSGKYAKKVLKLVNKERKKRGLKKLKLRSRMNKAARIRAKETSKSFSHTRPDGTLCFSVFQDLDIPYTMVGENIAAGQQSPEEVVDSWMHSEGHRANILSKYYRYMGLGLCKKSNSEYGYYWVQEFKR
ncbi:MAG: CAP domain-containing protein [Lachnospiraceae bacterium]|jgi:uncharacterized protein YkwD|nr:CAP domain-containing protein [Lachnospiraceae bacterium]MEE3461157.1 CAP domain-containing protein [Lachnospiraceae bacterium]